MALETITEDQMERQYTDALKRNNFNTDVLANEKTPYQCFEEQSLTIK